MHLILVRDDLATIIHKHPPVAKDGTIRETVTFPRPGRYRMVVDAYPATGTQPNFQLFRLGAGRRQGDARAAARAGRRGRERRLPLRDPGRKPKLKAIQATLLTIDVTDPQGKPARFTPYYGALAHAIFFRQGSLDYFHTHVCAPGASGCTSTLGGTQVTGTSAKPGRLTVGVLVPAPGTWRLFLQTKVGGRVVTAPFTLDVK